MAIAGDALKQLPASHQKALDSAMSILTDEFFRDLAILAQNQPFEETTMSMHLPKTLYFDYNFMFGEKFVVALLTVIWKLRSNQDYLLGCVAEELSLNAIINCAEELLELRGIKADFTLFEDLVYEDMDFEILFDWSLDGAEDCKELSHLGYANLVFQDWFKPFRENVYIHPYCSDWHQEGKRGNHG